MVSNIYVFTSDIYLKSPYIYARVGFKWLRIFLFVVKYVGGFWPIGVFFAGYRSFFFVPSRQTQTKARL